MLEKTRSYTRAGLPKTARPCYARLAKCIVGLLAHPAQVNLDSQVRISDLSRDVSREQRARHQASLGVESVGAEYPSPASASR